MVQDPEQSEFTRQREDIFRKIEKIFSSKDSNEQELARTELVNDRVNSLTEQSVKRQISLIGKEIRGFIHPDSEIQSTAIAPGFKLDDKEIYDSLIKNLGELRKIPGFENTSLRELVPWAILQTLGEYYGQYYADSNVIPEHHAFYQERAGLNSQSFSVGELKGKKIALCTERAGMAQNMLAFLGYDSLFIMSDLYVFGDKRERSHAYNVVTTEKGHVIFEPTIPAVVRDEKGNIINFLPSSYPITEDQYKQLIGGGRIEVMHTDFVSRDNKYKPREQKRVYSGPINSGFSQIGTGSW